MYKCASFFAGVGGIDLGFEETGAFETVYANEFDPYPAKTFELNSPIKVDVRDIHEVGAEEIPSFDVMLGGFPCQAFSIAGRREGFGDTKGRGELFFELVRILEAKRPRVAFFENVKNLVGHDNGNTFRVICEQLDLLGYKHTHKVLNAMEYGNVAQNRERIYIVAFRDEADFERFEWPKAIPLTNTVKDIIDFTGKVDDRYYYTPGRYKDSIYNARDIYVQIFYYVNTEERDLFLKGLNVSDDDIYRMTAEAIYDKFRCGIYLESCFFVCWIDKNNAILLINSMDVKSYAFGKREFWKCPVKNAMKPAILSTYLRV